MAALGAKYQQYEEYKESGIEWVGDIPAHWEETPVLSCFEANSEKNLDGKETNVLSLSYGNIIKRDVDTNFGLLPESFNTYQIVSAGDIILRLTDLQNDKKSLRVGLAKQKGIITSAYLKLKPKERLDSGFAYRLLHSYDTTKVYYGLGGGLRQSMKFEDFRRLPILIPPYEEQIQINRFLDYEVTRIDTLIEKQQTLIQLLKEKRQAVISHAVTKGLNPDAPMKDSGVEWLGEVPEHWVMATVRRIISRMEQGKSPQCESSPAKLNEWGVLKTSCVNGGNFQEEENKLLPSHIAPHEEYEVKAGDLLMSRASGSINLIGSVVLVQNNVRAKLLLSDKVFRIYLNKDYDSLFFTYLMSSSYMRSSIEVAISGAEGMANNIAKSSIMEFVIPILPLDEQVVIASHLKNIESKYISLISKAEQAIQLMQERRTALISAAVTGKIDVRGWQAPDIDIL